MTKARLRACARRCGLLAAGGALLLLRRGAAQGCARGVTLCAEVLLPTLFPFLILTAMLSRELGAPGPGTRRLLRRLGLPSCGGGALLLGAAGGFPVGAGYAAEVCAQGQCTPGQARRLALVCSGPGPAFVIGALGGGMLGDLRAGVLIFAAQLAAGLLFVLLLPKEKEAVQPIGFTISSNTAAAVSPGFLGIVSESFSRFLNICAFVILCSAVSGALTEIVPPGLPTALVSAVLELTGGAASLVHCGLKQKYLLPMLALSCGWGGVSVQLQSLQLLRQSGIPCRGWMAFQLLRGAAAAVITAVALHLLSSVFPFYS